jgi:hypothetical protein
MTRKSGRGVGKGIGSNVHRRNLFMNGLTGASDIMAARRARVAQASKSLGKGSIMAKLEITFSRNVDYSMELNDRKIRELADHLDIEVRELKKLVERGDLCDEYEAGLIEFMTINDTLEQQTQHGDIEIDQITLG